MDYQKLYRSIVEKRKSAPLSGLVEAHHIIPKCLGGCDDKSNIVKLTPREHFFCHYLLAKIHGGKLWGAYFFMAQPSVKSATGVKITSRQYAVAREKFIEYMATLSGPKNGHYGKKHSESTKEKISIVRKKYTKKMHPRADLSKKEWVHNNGNLFFGSHFDLAEKTGISHSTLKRVSAGQLFSYKGWSCPESGRQNMRAGENTNTADTEIYTWISPNGEKITNTRFYMRKNYGLDQSGLSNLVRGYVKKHKGWSVCL